MSRRHRTRKDNTRERERERCPSHLVPKDADVNRLTQTELSLFSLSGRTRAFFRTLNRCPRCLRRRGADPRQLVDLLLGRRLSFARGAALIYNTEASFAAEPCRPRPSRCQSLEYGHTPRRPHATGSTRPDRSYRRVLDTKAPYFSSGHCAGDVYIS